MALCQASICCWGPLDNMEAPRPVRASHCGTNVVNDTRREAGASPNALPPAALHREPSKSVEHRRVNITRDDRGA
eukprot:11167652-Lingulodinium_polyedra.AAC.1